MLKSQRRDVERDKLIEKSKKKKWIDKVLGKIVVIMVNVYELHKAGCLKYCDKCRIDTDNVGNIHIE